MPPAILSTILLIAYPMLMQLLVNTKHPLVYMSEEAVTIGFGLTSLFLFIAIAIWTIFCWSKVTQK